MVGCNHVVLHVTFTSRPSQRGNNVGDDDRTSRTPLISLPCTTLHYLAIPCATLSYPATLFCLSLEFNVEEVMHKLCVYPASHEENPTKTPDP